MQQNKQDECQVYLEERKQLIGAERETAQQFDKAILTLAAGALALSITFIKQIAPHPKSQSIYFLIAAWTFFSLSILSTLISFLKSQDACRRQREILDQDRLSKPHDNKNSAANWTNRFNWLSIVFFISGIISLIIFSVFNIPKGG
ncbi:MAG: hypothetical protein KGJ87_07580 [Planctomycetota bacterium]|nr:hypothetical protein [Planctomycetota bacterium]MDE2217000.1 hypothetical protein [Planctomycetota bacterium]